MVEYTTIHRLRQEGFAQADLPEADALRLIREASEILSDVLGQWFVPVRSQKRLDGDGSSICYHPNRIPILEVISLEEDYTADVSGDYMPSRMDILVGGADRTSFPPDDFVIRGRFVELLYARFFRGRGNVVLDAYTGWMDWFDQESRSTTLRKVETDITTAINYDGTEAIVTSLNDFDLRDVLVFEKNDTTREVLGMAIVNGIETGTSKLQFDKLKTKNKQQLPIGTKVVTFGAVPRLIERATILILKKLQHKINSEEYDERLFGEKLKSEKTDRYSYTLYGGADGGGVGITGDSLVDSQLSKYTEPPYVDLS